MGSAQLELQGEDGAGALPIAALAALEGAGLREQAAARLAAHRARRAGQERSGTAGSSEGRPARRHKAASAVAERYAQTPSFRAVLAAEARRAIEQADAAAEIAARTAAAVADAQLELLSELSRYDEPVKFSAETAGVLLAPAACVEATAASGAPARERSAAGLTVRLYEDLGPLSRVPHGGENRASGSPLDAQEERALDDEIAFRQAPVFEAQLPPEPSTPLPANLLEFPRQLVAARRVRPRLAEGPLREDSPGSPQLRIFEVDPLQMITALEPISSVPEWSSIWLDAQAPGETVLDPRALPENLLASLLPPEVAPMQLRLMAAALDTLLVLCGFAAFLTAAVWSAGTVTLALPLLMAAAASLFALYVIYHLLFFSLSTQTPGMRFARIGLCTFSDENPSRSAMRRRILAKLIAACPLGLGVLWVLLDDDRLGWHDRISRMYHRAY